MLNDRCSQPETRLVTYIRLVESPRDKPEKSPVKTMQHDVSIKFVRVPVEVASHTLEDVLKREDDLSLMRQLLVRAGVVGKEDG